MTDVDTARHHRPPLRVALVGCGQIADVHLQEMRRTGLVTPVAVCDRHIDLARQAAERFRVPEHYDDFEAMLRLARPDVVHIATPPQTHHRLTLAALASGAHVYVEKPVSVDAAEAEEMVDRATAAGRLLCAGHDHLYDPVWQRCREIVASGRLGAVVHVDSVHGYSLGGPYGALLTADPDHWVHKLPGGLFHNVMSHALYKITDYLRDETPRIAGFSFSPPGGPWFPTELRVLIHGRHVTGALTFTASALPAQRVVRVLGTRGSIEVDFDGRLIRSMPSPSMPGPLARVEIPWRQFREAWGNWKRNASRLLHADLHFFAGMQCLFTEFYRAILEDGAPPIAYDEIVRVARISDAIFASSVDRAAPGGEREAVPTRQPELEEVRA